jgi:YD repeat-containing protein
MTSSGGLGNDLLLGRGGHNHLEGGPGDDQLEADNGNDTLLDGMGHDQILGRGGDDVLEGGPGDDFLDAKGGNDILQGNDGDDFLEAKGGNDILQGGAGNDTLSGGEDDDQLAGGVGTDTLTGNTGTDTCLGGETLTFCEADGPGDTTTPTLPLTTPSGEVIDDLTPAIAVQYADTDTGIDLTTLRVLVDALDITPTCLITTTSATCEPPALGAGSHTASATLRDLAGNLATASTNFTLTLTSGQHTATFSASADTFLAQNSAHTNQGEEPVLRIQDSSTHRVLVRFDPVHLAAVVDEGTLLSATLELFIEHNADNWGSSGRSMDVHRLTEDWEELGAAWQCANDTDLSNALPDCATPWPGGSVLASPAAMALAPDGSLYIADADNGRIRQVKFSLSHFSIGNVGNAVLASADGTLVYDFTAAGRHLRTVDAITGQDVSTFGYDSAGRLITVQDIDGDITRIERDAVGTLTAIVTPDGQRTTLTVNAQGYLATVTNPAGETYYMTYTADGLLTAFTTPRGHVNHFTYDALGRLVHDLNAGGGGWTLTHTKHASGYTNDMTSAKDGQAPS